ncbi:hypothetical protein RhiirA5_422209 [Rhizophagus irregularis]|uniref:Uncharacterized protein n=2 Tax=Rhizophagus irregularis TaxID=588596 RepID=A0A2N0PCB9_9GLOM|nr:hypothetical protein RhiirA5_422209 [Rhizophagus irregularis]GBC50514.2 hypothetical protein RIR_jg11566.t1 [Rhizophagus irregularis DAOM 181602=DAOM 197198]PKC56486.1 hypothetical protein RhiirA1_473922 [Rhizophagus irregularis]UZO00268.1 hypothetical protein OCT59_001520 [Rhizophagus irregularis]CAB4493282.1 unnamed protein product [Rhizophagus irregularis]
MSEEYIANYSTLTKEETTQQQMRKHKPLVEFIYSFQAITLLYIFVSSRDSLIELLYGIFPFAIGVGFVEK